jgi:hypothetical protein
MASRIAATLGRFRLCLRYLLFLPFHGGAWRCSLAQGALIVVLDGRLQDVVAAGITTAVTLDVAAVASNDAWQQPILRLAGTIVGVAVSSQRPGSRCG